MATTSLFRRAAADGALALIGVALAVIASTLSGGAAAEVSAECTTTTGLPGGVPQPDGDCDGFSDAHEAYLGTDPEAACGFEVGLPLESDTWPADLFEDNVIELIDVYRLEPYLNQSVPDAPVRYDLYSDGRINIQDVLVLRAFFHTTCLD
jgi:hypothetical protein